MQAFLSRPFRYYIFRWMLLSFKREFSWEDSMRCFEILSSHHLEVFSLEAEKTRSVERRKDFQKQGINVYSCRITYISTVVNTDYR